MSGADAILRIREVLAATGVSSRGTVYKAIREGRFPAPVRLRGLSCNAVGWRASEVAAAGTLRRRRKIPPECIALIEQMRAAGKSYVQIAQATGLCAGSVSWYCLDRCIDGPSLDRSGPVAPYKRGGRDVRPFMAAEDDAITQMRIAGASLAEIGMRLLRHPGSVRMRLITLARREEREAA